MQGHTDVPLDATGHRQSAAAAQALAALQPVVLVSSDLARARETAAYVEASTGLVASLDKRLREFDVGVRAGMTHDQFAATYPAEHAAWRAGEERPVVEGAETSSDVRARVVPALRSLLDGLPEDGTGIAVMHGACARVAVAGLLDWPDQVLRGLRGLDNCGWAVLDADAEHGLRLVAYNRTAPIS